MRRAEKRGKELPPLLKAALEAQANDKFLITSSINYENPAIGADVYNGQITGDCVATLTTCSGKPNCSGSKVLYSEILDMTHANDVIRECGDTCPTLQARMGTGGNQIPLVFESTYSIQDNTIERSDTAGANGKGVIEDRSYTLNTVDRHAVCHAVGFSPNNSSTAAGLSEEDEKSPTLSTTKIGGTIYAIDRAAFNQGENAKYDFQIEDSGINSTIVARGPSAVCYNISGSGIAGTLDAHYYMGCGNRGGKEREIVACPNDIGNYSFIWIVRRLTPLECERLQGFPDYWTMYDTNENELKDTPRYKTLGNSIAIPCALRVFKGIIEAEAAS